MKDRVPIDELLSPRQVEELYGFQAQTLANWRWTGLGPDYIKMSPGKGGRIRYKRSAVEAWLDERTVSGGAAA
ncbi:helix-turn-helix transcriptional regulator [Streptomyces sp. NPDC005494]|uniref:helix-turn-helix transcriptional regulator n=1 Tax=Streptomyces sp. NPDC005494 TaxID=3364715 RepID=UPI0036A0B1F4